MKRSTRVTAVAAGTAVSLATAGVAFALWSANGAGSGSASTGTARNLTVTAAATDAGLYPGGPAGAVGFSVTNPNPYPVTLTGVSYGDLDASGTCGADDVVLSGTAPTTLDLTVPAGGTTAGTLPGVIGLAQDAGDECQGVTLSVDLALSGSQR